MRRLRPLRPADLDDDQRALRAALADPPGRVPVAADGSLDGPFDAMLRAPATGAPLQALGAALRYAGVLPERVRELAVLLVAAHQRSAFEWYAHDRVAAALGVPQAWRDAIRTGAAVTPDDPAEHAAVTAVAELLASGDLSDVAWDRAVTALGEDGAVELLTLVGYYALLATQMRVLRVPLPDGATAITFGAVSRP